MKDLIALGELLIDLTQTHVDENRIRHFAANPGGAPANVAVAAARLGAKTGFIGKVGADVYGRDLRAVLDRAGVDTAGLYETAASLTTQALVSVSETGERSFSFYRNPGADSLLTLEEARAALERNPPRVLHIGSVSLTTDPARAATLAAAELARSLGAKISYDPNYRAALWPDEATAVKWMKQPLPLTDILKISDEELPLLTGTDDLEAGSRALSEQGIGLVLITLGGAGTFYRRGGETGRVPGFTVAVADTNGAGDTFLGALLRRLTAGNSDPSRTELEEIIRFANCAAALTCSRPGAISAMPALTEVETKLREEVTT